MPSAKSILGKTEVHSGRLGTLFVRVIYIVLISEKEIYAAWNKVMSEHLYTLPVKNDKSIIAKFLLCEMTPKGDWMLSM